MVTPNPMTNLYTAMAVLRPVPRAFAHNATSPFIAAALAR